MKNLPDQFPIRYAIIVSNNKDRGAGDDLTKSKINSLWSQLIEYLKKKPLDTDDLSLGFRSVSYTDKDENKLCDIGLLNGTKEWADDFADILIKSLPTGTLTKSRGDIFDLTLYSYKGMGEMSIYSKIISCYDQEKVLNTLTLKSLGYFSIDGLKKSTQDKYDKITSNKHNLWTGFRMLNEPSVFYLQLPYSALWKLLDTKTSKGVASFNEIKDELKSSEEVQSTLINVVVAKDIESLITEEILAIYKMSNFCQSCSKILPKKYKGKFCPSTRENRDCIRKRNRMRQKKME